MASILNEPDITKISKADLLDDLKNKNFGIDTKMVVLAELSRKSSDEGLCLTKWILGLTAISVLIGIVILARGH